MVQEAAQPLISKITQTDSFGSEDLDLLQTLVGLQNAEEAPEPEPDDKVIASGNESEGSMIRTPTKSAGYTTLRRNMDGKLLPMNNNQLATRLQERLQDGRKAFLAPDAPWTGPAPGKLVCHFNPLHPQSKRLSDMGLMVECKKANIKNAAQLRIHERKKHKTDYASMEEIDRKAVEDEIREEQRTLNRAILTAVGGDTKVLDQVRKTYKAPTPDEAVAGLAAATGIEAEEDAPFLPTEEQPERRMVGGTSRRKPGRPKSGKRRSR